MQPHMPVAVSYSERIQTMNATSRFAIGIALAALSIVAGACGNAPSAPPPACGAGVMTPYSSRSMAIQGATLVWKDRTSANELQRMHDEYCINTVNIYGLEWIPDSDKDVLFSELARLGMKIVVRIEAYDATTFAFRASDLDWIMDRYSRPLDGAHGSLLDYLSASPNRGSVAYLALNMPVDDPAVQARAGGLNSERWIQAQKDYAPAFVQRIRAFLTHAGFPDAKLFLSVFYGWDGSFNVPSYLEANADGFFLNNYSYPAGTAPDETALDAQLINRTRLQGIMDGFEAQYRGHPQVIEYGFHTVQFNAGRVPDQTAGLVQTREAKRRALLATTNYYSTSFPDVVGTIYFAYNMLKVEGRPPALLDWTLLYDRSRDRCDCGGLDPSACSNLSPSACPSQ